MPNHSLFTWFCFGLFILLLLAIDLGIVHKRQHAISVREAIGLSLFYVSLSLLFNVWVFYVDGKEAAYQFFSGYLIEKSLSLDNIFVFVLIFRQFAVPAAYQHRVLYYGILGALVLRMVLIFAGTALIARFQWLLTVFGVLLMFTGFKMFYAAIKNKAPELKKNALVTWVQRFLRVTPKYHEQRFVVKLRKVWHITPLLLVLILIEASDVLFALDSIPAIFAITQDPFIIYTSNVFAILGLRALYFALAGVIDQVVYLKHGISMILIFVGVKMLLDTYFEIHVPTIGSLAVIASILTVALGFSWVHYCCQQRVLPKSSRKHKSANPSKTKRG